MDDGGRLTCCADLTPDCARVQQPSFKPAIALVNSNFVKQSNSNNS